MPSHGPCTLFLNRFIIIIGVKMLRENNLETFDFCVFQFLSIDPH